MHRRLKHRLLVVYARSYALKSPTQVSKASATTHGAGPLQTGGPQHIEATLPGFLVGATLVGALGSAPSQVELWSVPDTEDFCADLARLRLGSRGLPLVVFCGLLRLQLVGGGCAGSYSPSLPCKA